MSGLYLSGDSCRFRLVLDVNGSWLSEAAGRCRDGSQKRVGPQLAAGTCRGWDHADRFCMLAKLYVFGLATGAGCS